MARKKRTYSQTCIFCMEPLYKDDKVKAFGRPEGRNGVIPLTHVLCYHAEVQRRDASDKERSEQDEIPALVLPHFNWKRTPDKFEAHRRRAEAYNVAGQGDDALTPEQWSRILKKYGYKCLACDSRWNIEIDHVVPLSRGGGNIASNIQPLCKYHNDAKYTSIIDYRTGYGPA